MLEGTTLRPCRVCGMFYPADPGELRKQISTLLKQVNQRALEGRIRGLVSPHAGYIYSGYTAACGYALVQGGSYDTVVVVSPSHHEYFEGVSVFPGSGYQTPLGDICVNSRLRSALLDACDIVRASTLGHGEEHAVEVQLPFLQEVMSDFTFLPIVMGDQKRENCMRLGEALGDVLRNENALLIASTDLSHYYDYRTATMLDKVMVEDVRCFDDEALMKHLESTETEACGGGPTVAVMVALRAMGVRTMKILHHCNSGDVTGDHRAVVGYLSAAAYN